MTNIRSRAFEVFFAHTDEGVVVLDERGRMALVNQAWLRMFDLSADQVIGRPASELPQAMEMMDPDVFVKWVARSVSERRPVSHIYVQTLVPERTLLVTFFPVYENDGTFVGQVLIFREAGALSAEAALELIADTAYELSQPMTVVLGLGQLIRRQIVAGHPLARDLLTLERNIQRMSDIVRKLGRIVQYHRSSATRGRLKPGKLVSDNRLASRRPRPDK